MLNSRERDQVQDRLLAERDRALDALREFDRERSDSLRERASELTVYRLHLADIGTEAMEQEKQFLLASNEGRRLYEIDDALRRLYGDPDHFGICENCGREIGIARLDMVPQTTLCAECQRGLE